MRPIVELEELKQIELNIMKEVHEFCVLNEIWYVLTYGTLLGAIRHNGFIPWDDDIDIHMTREGYNKFIDLFPAWGKDRNLKLIGPHSEGNEFPRDLLKVCDSRTVLIEKAYKNGCKMGVFVDIWPLDKVHKNESAFEMLWIDLIYMIKRISLASDIDKKSDKYKQLNIKKRLFVSLFGKFDAKKLVLTQERLSQRYNNTQDAKYISFQANKRFYDEKDIFPAVLHKFEDTEFYIPNNYDAILQSTYGDYMELPPIEKRQPQHSQIVFWL